MIYGEKATYKDVARELEPYESNLRCLKSIKYDPRKANAVFASSKYIESKPQVSGSHFFRSINRDQGRTFIPKLEVYNDDEDIEDARLEKPASTN